MGVSAKFYTDDQGNYLGGFDEDSGAFPPPGAIEVAERRLGDTDLADSEIRASRALRAIVRELANQAGVSEAEMVTRLKARL